MVMVLPPMVADCGFGGLAGGALLGEGRGGDGDEACTGEKRFMVVSP
jgi:hypothetical protein